MRLLEGLDDIGLTLKHADEIKAWEQHTAAAQPGCKRRATAGRLSIVSLSRALVGPRRGATVVLPSSSSRKTRPRMTLRWDGCGPGENEFQSGEL
jgi:hypothetical protein